MPLTIHSANGDHRFTVEVAATPEQQQRGLMFRRELAPDKGMIFPYNPPQEVGFWMKNTLIPLDMVFIRADGTIARISHATALSLDLVPSGEPIAAVLEIAGGWASELGIKRRRPSRVAALIPAPLRGGEDCGRGPCPWDG